MSKLLCIYHGHCDDGFAAAWCVREALGEKLVEFYAGQYQRVPPDVTGRHVLLVDFSYKRHVLLEMAAKARSIVILDHHKTAQEDLAGFQEPAPYSEWSDGTLKSVKDGNPPIAALFDMNRSGAGLAWDFFFPDVSRPQFIDYVEDRDLWRKSLPRGDEFTIALRSYPQDFAVWDQLVGQVTGLMNEGDAIQRFYRLRVEELKRSAYLADIRLPGTDGPAPSDIGIVVTCAIANAPYFAASEVAGELCEMSGAEFGACYFEVGPGRWAYSLRARGDFDVSAIAKQFGGGGHKAASGFTVDSPVHQRRAA